MPLVLLLSACAIWVPNYPGPLASLGKPPPLPSPAEVVAPSPVVSAHVAASHRDEALARDLVAAAGYYLDHRDLGGGRPDDCSGFVAAVFDRGASVSLALGVTNLWAQAEKVGATHHRHLPAIGDLAFFDDTWDADGDGKIDDPLSHVGVVVKVDDDGTITFAQGGIGKGRDTMVMNLEHPHDRTDADGKVINDNLRMPRKSDPAGTRYFAAELWHGFATVDAAQIEAWNQAK